MVHLRQKLVFGASLAAVANLDHACAFGLSPLSKKTRRGHGLCDGSFVASPASHLRSSTFKLKTASLRGGGADDIAIDGSGTSGLRSNAKKALGTAAILLAFSQYKLVAQLLSSALDSYRYSLNAFPLRTKVLTGATLAVLGDYLAQMKAIKGSPIGEKGYDKRRGVSFAMFDSCYRCFQNFMFPIVIMLGQGKVIHTLLSSIPKISLGKESFALLATLERTFIYQFVLVPFIYYPVFFTFTGFVQGLSLSETIQRGRAGFFQCCKRNWMFWIPMQMVMFGLVAEQWQIPFTCVMGIVWASILSVTAGKARE